MELLERYVNAVKSFLPKQQQDDIGKEISANLQSQMDDREEELGRPLSEAEQEAILKQHGHPMIVAGRYQANQGSLVFGRQLIGATLFPFYIRVLWINLGISFAIYLIVLIALAASGNTITFQGTLNAILLQIFFQFVIVTSIFTTMERYQAETKWDVRRPPTLQPVFRKTQWRPRLESIAELIAISVFLAWLWLVLARPSLLFGPAADTYQLGPVWYQVALPTLLIYGVSVVQAVVTLFRPAWAQFRPAVRLATDVATLGIVVYLLRASNWVVLVHPNSASGSALGTINTYVHYGLLSTAIGGAIVVLVDGWKLIRQTRQQAA